MKENSFLIPIGRRLAEIRRSHHMTQEELADRLGVSPKHVSHTECGTSSLSLKNLIEFCSIFDCSMDYIILGKAKDDALSKVPEDILKILYTGSASDVERLNRYLSIYAELLNRQD